jgi:hypothetical protein
VADVLAEDAGAVVAAIRAGGGTTISAKIGVTSEAEWTGLIGKTLAVLWPARHPCEQCRDLGQLGRQH